MYGQEDRPRLGAVGGRRATGDCSTFGIKTLHTNQRTTSDFRETVMEARYVCVYVCVCV